MDNEATKLQQSNAARIKYLAAQGLQIPEVVGPMLQLEVMRQMLFDDDGPLAGRGDEYVVAVETRIAQILTGLEGQMRKAQLMQNVPAMQSNQPFSGMGIGKAFPDRR